MSGDKIELGNINKANEKTENANLEEQRGLGAVITRAYDRMIGTSERLTPHKTPIYNSDEETRNTEEDDNRHPRKRQRSSDTLPKSLTEVFSNIDNQN